MSTSQTICKPRCQIAKMLDTNTEGSHPEQDDYNSDSDCTNCGASHSAENMNSEYQESSAPNANIVAEKTPDPPMLHAEIIMLSETLKFLMNFKLVLILFLGFSWLYEQN
ncbi:hypothetical protein B0H14DRAFT_2648091 [Mycena olivaceomarginata]|nr:hypothetical protein B0H14DRAFT_2648091 [Mycena olivaceomarginata]